MRIPTRRTCSVRTALLTRDSNPKSIKITTPTGPCFGLVGVCAVFMPYFPAGAVGAAARPVRRISYAEMAKRKASPGGEAGATSVATDEVEAKNYHRRMVLRCDLRPHPSRARARDTFPSRGRLWPVLRRQPLPPLIRPPVRVATFPQGKALLRRSAGFTIL